jgi:hypothetical protein
VNQELGAFSTAPGGAFQPRTGGALQPARGLVRLGGAAQIGGDRVDARLCVGELPNQQVEWHSGFCGQVRRLGFGNKAIHVVDALRHHETEFAQMRADRVRKLGQLPREKIPRPMAHQNRLLDLGLDGHEPHRRLHDGRADRPCICGGVRREFDPPGAVEKAPSS